MKRRKRRGKSGTPSGHGSKFDQWFAARTQPPSGTFSRPVERRRKTTFSDGPTERHDEQVEPAGPRRARHPRAGYARPRAKRRSTPSLRCSANDPPRHRRVPAKARTIAGYLGGDFVVESSIGHIRDLPNRASDVPKEQRERYGKLGVDVDHEFEPYYVVDADKKRVVSDLKQKLRDADELLLATDEDREGEAIAWHLREVLKPKVPVRRMVFHEITRDAIRRALDETRDIDERLVDAQETRRILDRLYGFEVSPVLWKKVMPRLSAGRVQSVATRLVVERERERMRFVAASYWDVLGTFEPGSFEARLVARRRQAHRAGPRLRRDGEAGLGRPRARRGACPRARRRPRGHGPSPSARSTRSPTRAARRRRSGPRRCSRRRAASCGSPPRRRCASPSGSTRTATSRTCAPTR